MSFLNLDSLRALFVTPYNFTPPKSGRTHMEIQEKADDVWNTVEPDQVPRLLGNLVPRSSNPLWNGESCP